MWRDICSSDWAHVQAAFNCCDECNDCDWCRPQWIAHCCAKLEELSAHTNASTGKIYEDPVRRSDSWENEEPLVHARIMIDERMAIC